MEAMKQWEETEEVGEALRGRLPHHQQSNTISTTVSSDFVFSSETSSEAEEGEEVGERPRNGTFISGKNGGTESPYGISGFNGENVDFLTSKKNPGDETVEAKEESLSHQKSVVVSVTNQQDVDDMKGEELPSFDSSPSKQAIERGGGVNLREIREQEVSELYLERVYEKPAAHDFYCPNCNSCITKVIIRGRKWENVPPTAPPPVIDDPIRCTSCFSFLIPAGNWFFPKSVPKDEGNLNEQGTVIENSVERGVSALSHDLDGALQDQNSKTTSVSKGPVPNEAVGASVAATAKPSGNNLQGSVGFEVPVPSHDLNETFHDKKPSMPTQSVGVSKATTIDKAPVPGEAVEVSFGVSAKDKLSVIYSESSTAGVEASIPSHDLKGTVHNLKPSVLGQSIGVSVVVTTKPPAPEIDVVPSSEDAQQLIENDGGLAKTGIRDSTIVTIVPEPTIITEPADTKTFEIIKSIVYGGLTEAITSLGIVTSAASADTATLNILALALANLIGGLFIIGHNLWELKNDESRVPSSQTDEHVDRYQKVLGKKDNFLLHASVAILSFIVFGLVPPVVYSFSFRQSNNRDLKMAAVAGASLLCIIILAIGKAYTQKPPKYIKTLLYYVAIGIGVGGVSYLAGDLIDKLIEKLGWFSSNVSGTLPLPQMAIVKPTLESY
ncbi:membrane protein of ER body-like protein [Prunus yedoensis var. nudiflora]|uniref:Membrane protein of ER body-like protein n=1 Tax=Prunus yedoensis var. nudiflora TaxID=2094558 RepID=A0A314XN02_PRUYE|nr:membrane protein of ER body-like protein [Prunus yedoensis var. nudiflora]